MPEAPPAAPPRPTQSSITSPRSRRQLGLFFGGCVFFGISTLITRRSLLRRYAATRPAFYHPSNRPAGDVNGAMEAFEALNIATINVLSFAMMGVGGALWVFDISTLADLRTRVREGMGFGGDRVGGEKDADEEMEEWLATVLERRDRKEGKRREERERGTVGKDGRDGER
ncbi:MAG: hypothetical protein M1827_007440 [Pycnora praestabilis]|nr:MAG: hypothetical protein M1827_007440 [Pycnora praestabilis]